MRGWSIPDARKDGTRHSGRETSGDGIGECNGATAAREDDEEEAAGSGTRSRSRANTFGAVCYVTSLLGERGGLLKRLVVTRLSKQLAPLSLRLETGAMSNLRKIRELLRGSPSPSSPLSSHGDNKRGEIKRYTRPPTTNAHEIFCKVAIKRTK